MTTTEQRRHIPPDEVFTIDRGRATAQVQPHLLPRATAIAEVARQEDRQQVARH